MSLEKDLKLEPCRLCGKPFNRRSLIIHAHKAHPVEYRNWHEPRGGFGITAVEHFSFRNVTKAVIRS